MAWQKVDKAPLSKSERRETPDGLWQKCPSCNKVIYQKDVALNFYACPKCEYHFPIPYHKRIKYFLDPDSFKEYDSSLSSTDPLKFKDQKTYKEKLGHYYKYLKLRDGEYEILRN